MQKREFKNSEMLSIIGFGGILVSNVSQEEANEYIAEAVDIGINYFDVAPTYGNAQDRMGPGLVGKRDGIFLTCKTTKRMADEADKELSDSLKKLKTDRFDLYLLHGVNNVEEAKTCLGPKGALEALVKARDKGYIRYLGFSVHSEDAAIYLMNRFDFDAVMFPVNWVCFLTNGFGKRIMETAVKKDLAVLALKGMAHTTRPKDYKEYPKTWYKPVEDKELAQLALRYTLSQPVTTALTPGHMNFLRCAMEVGQNFTPITEDEINILKEKSQGTEPLFKP
jgi:predicted aldo/keto reductase-like oxidoreductase